MNPMRVLHTGDFHLGSDFRGVSAKSAVRRGDLKQTFLDMIGLCRTHQVELLLIPGDLFESWSVPQELLELVSEAFASIPTTQVVIAAGNHDPLTADSPYLQKDRWSENVLILPPRFGSVVLDSLGVELWGCSFSSTYASHSLFGQVRPSQPDYLQIGVIHGTVGSDSVASEYNPISTRQIEESGLDYLALAHTHKPSGLLLAGQTHYAYPGCPEGRGFDELGPRGVLLGELGRRHCTMEFVPICQRMHLIQTVDLTGTGSSRTAAGRILEELQALQGAGFERHLYRVLLTGELPDSVNLSLDSIKGLLSQLFYLQLRDRTQLDIDRELVAKELSLKGIFVSKMMEKLDSDDPQIPELALKLGLKAFFGEVSYHED